MSFPWPTPDPEIAGYKVLYEAERRNHYFEKERADSFLKLLKAEQEHRKKLEAKARSVLPGMEGDPIMGRQMRLLADRLDQRRVRLGEDAQKADKTGMELLAVAIVMNALREVSEEIRQTAREANAA